MKSGVIVQNNGNEPWPIGLDMDLAMLSDKLGFDSFWINSSLPAKDPFLVLLAAGKSTNRISLGTNVVNPYSKHPAALASEAATLQMLAGRDVILGLGSSFAEELEPFGVRRDHPVEVVREATKIAKMLLSGGPVDFSGNFYKLSNCSLNFAPSSRIPIVIGAQGERMLAMAGEVADGIIIPAGNFRFYEFAIEAFNRGLTKGKRKRSEVEVIANVNFVLSDDIEKVMQETRPSVADSIAYRSAAALKVMGFTVADAQEIGKNPDL